MQIIKDLIDSVDSDGIYAETVMIGLHWTALQSRFVGMSHTYKTNRKIELEGSGDFMGMSLNELMGKAYSWEPLDASLGIAAINSLIEANGRKGNVNEYILEHCSGKSITVIGRFPFNDEVRMKSSKCYLLEVEPKKNELPPFACEEVIPKSDIAVISATALINHSLKRLLELCIDTEAIVLGPTTPMNDVLFKYGADVVAGVKTIDPRALMLSVAQGAKSFKKLRGLEPIMRFKE